VPSVKQSETISYAVLTAAEVATAAVVVAAGTFPKSVPSTLIAAPLASTETPPPLVPTSIPGADTEIPALFPSTEKPALFPSTEKPVPSVETPTPFDPEPAYPNVAAPFPNPLVLAVIPDVLMVTPAF
jgi:hypothetical protein